MAYRTEHPNPQFRRDDWVCLNGSWDFEIDDALTGIERGLPSRGISDRTIELPFCPESGLSGVKNTGFMRCVWYSRRIALPKERAGRRLLLHIGACDYQTEVWVDGAYAGIHYGGYSSFAFDITKHLSGDDCLIVIRAVDELPGGMQPCGKQSPKEESFGCFYTRTTGIWQTVWLESVPEAYIADFSFLCDCGKGTLTITAECENADGALFAATASFDGRDCGGADARVSGRVAVLTLALDETHLWAPGEPSLYGLTMTLGDDTVHSYFGLREICFKNGKTYLNGKPFYQRLVLDQGFYPDGIYTAPTAGALEADIINSMSLGFNGARLHQKVFEPLFLYYCDKHGYVVWGEHASWGIELADRAACLGFLAEWREIVLRDRNHPAIIGWCPLNETGPGQDKRFVAELASFTRALDATRLYVETSGWAHIDYCLGMPDGHDYDQDPDSFRARYAPLEHGEPAGTIGMSVTPYPVFISEYGGICLNTGEVGGGWGYGTAPEGEQEFLRRYEGLTSALLDNSFFTAFCYTQLTDVEQEVNGLMTYDRRFKLDPALIRAINTRPSAFELGEDK